MRTTNVAAGAGKLQGDIKNLRAHWDIAGEHWDDVVRRDFEETKIVPLERAVESALRAMEELQQVFRQMARDVGPRE